MVSCAPSPRHLRQQPSEAHTPAGSVGPQRVACPRARSPLLFSSPVVLRGDARDPSFPRGMAVGIWKISGPRENDAWSLQVRAIFRGNMFSFLSGKSRGV